MAESVQQDIILIPIEMPTIKDGGTRGLLEPSGPYW